MTLSNAIRIHKNGGPEELVFEKIEVGDPGPRQILIRHTAIGLNFTDIHHRTGRYPVPGGVPLVLGMEAAGVVEQVGSEVVDFRLGDRVVYGGASPGFSPGAYTEFRVLDASRVVRLPEWIDDQTAAAVFLKGLTAHYLLRSAYKVREGQTILVHAAAGGVGLILCQWARFLGATAIGTVSSREKAGVARDHGCHHTIIATEEDVVARVRELTGGKGVPVVYDSVGKDTFEISLACLERRGMVVSFGSASGPAPLLDIFRLNRMGSLYVTSAGLADYIREPADLLERATELFEAVRKGVVRVSINQRYPLADAARAHRDLESRRTVGSSIITP